MINPEVSKHQAPTCQVRIGYLHLFGCCFSWYWPRAGEEKEEAEEEGGEPACCVV